jgi:hypothetical protein
MAVRVGSAIAAGLRCRKIGATKYTASKVGVIGLDACVDDANNNAGSLGYAMCFCHP